MNFFNTMSRPHSFQWKVLILCITIFSGQLFAKDYNFRSFKVTEKLARQQQRIIPLQIENVVQAETKKATRSLFKLMAVSEKSLGEQTKVQTVSTSESTSLPSEQGNLYTRIINYLNPNYTHIGNTQSSSLINYNRSYNMGSQNYSGFTWQKPMANFYIGVDRQVEPDLFSDTRWIVKDKFVISVNAFTYLSNLKEEGMVEISDKQLAAFAGMEFIRIYRYTHFANSFNEGLTKEYNKLFLSFMLFRAEEFQQMDEYEFVTKEDYLSANAGGMIQIPTIPTSVGVGFNINAGALVEYKKISQLMLQKVGPMDQHSEDEAMRVSYEVAKEKSVTAQAQLEADFFHLLKITLLSYELEYSFTDSDKLYLSFNHSDMDKLSGTGDLAKDFRKLLKMKRPDNLSMLKPFITTREHRLEQNRRSRYSILLFGGERSDDMEQVIIENEEGTKVFYKAYTQQLKYVRSIFSTILDSVFRAIFQTSLFKNFKASRLRKLAFEYQYDEDSIHQSDVVINDEGKLSFNITHQYTAKKTQGFWNKKYRKYAKSFTSKFTNLSSNYISAIDKNRMRGPLSIKTIFRIGKEQLRYLNHQSPARMKHKFKLICESVSRYKSKKRRCVKKIWNKYVDYRNAWAPNNDMALNKLKNFISILNKYSDSSEDIRYVFGEKTFFSGTFQATLADGKSHLTYFKDGTFQGLGVIDNYRRESITRAPASIKH